MKEELKLSGTSYSEDDVEVINFFGRKIDKLVSKEIPVAEPPYLGVLEDRLIGTNHQLQALVRAVFYAPIMLLVYLLAVWLLEVYVSGAVDVPFSLFLLVVGCAFGLTYYAYKEIFK